MHSSKWRSSLHQWREWFNKKSGREKEQSRRREMWGGGRGGSDKEKEIEDGSNQVSLETHKAYLNLRGLLSPHMTSSSSPFSCAPQSVWRLPAHPSQILCPSLPLALIKADFFPWRMCSVKRSSKSSVTSSAGVVKAERRAVQSGTRMA